MMKVIPNPDAPNPGQHSFLLVGDDGETVATGDLLTDAQIPPEPGEEIATQLSFVGVAVSADG